MGGVIYTMKTFHPPTKKTKQTINICKIKVLSCSHCAFQLLLKDLLIIKIKLKI